MVIKKTNKWVQPDLLMADDEEFERELRERNRNRVPKKPKYKNIEALRCPEFRKNIQSRLRAKGIHANINIVTLLIACFIEEVRQALFDGKSITLRLLGTFTPRINFKVVKSPITNRLEYDRPYHRPYFLFNRELKKQLLRLWLVNLPVTEEMMPNWALRRLARFQRKYEIRQQKKLLAELSKMELPSLDSLEIEVPKLPDLSLPDLSIPEL